MNSVAVVFGSSNPCLKDVLSIRDISGLSVAQIKALANEGKEIPFLKLDDQSLFFKSDFIVDFVEQLEDDVSLRIEGTETDIETLREKAKQARSFNRGDM